MVLALVIQSLLRNGFDITRSDRFTQINKIAHT
jgi:hypothetical protein